MTETFHHQFFWYCNLLRRHMLNQERIFPHIARHQFQETRACFITKQDRVSESQFFFRVWDSVCLCRSSTVSLHQSSTPRHGTTIFRKNSHHQQKDQQDQMNMKKLDEKVHSTEPERSPGFLIYLPFMVGRRARFRYGPSQISGCGMGGSRHDKVSTAAR